MIFQDAMQHTYDYAKEEVGYYSRPKEIDDKVATGFVKDLWVKTNKYSLQGKGGNLQFQRMKKVLSFE